MYWKRQELKYSQENRGKHHTENRKKRKIKKIRGLETARAKIIPKKKGKTKKIRGLEKARDNIFPKKKGKRSHVSQKEEREAKKIKRIGKGKRKKVKSLHEKVKRKGERRFTAQMHEMKKSKKNRDNKIRRATARMLKGLSV